MRALVILRYVAGVSPTALALALSLLVLSFVAPPGPAKPPSAFEVGPGDKDDPYGPRRSALARLTVDQVIRYALDNPLVKAADEEVAALEAQLRKARFAWIPIVTTETTLSPGVRTRCDDVTLDDGSTTGFDFQYCRSRDDQAFDVNTVAGYFSQLADAGVRFRFKADVLFPITGFGKLKHIKAAGKAGIALKRLQKVATQQETVLRVHQAHATLLLARESIAILTEAKEIVDKAQGRIEKDLGGTSEDWDADPDAGNPLRDPDDEYKVRLANTEVELLMRQALKVQSLSLSALWALAGKRAPKHFDVREKRQVRYGAEGGLKSLKEYKQIAVRHRPEARMAAAAIRARSAQERLARAMFLPDLGIVLRFDFARANAADPEMSQLYYQDGFNFSRITAALALRWKWDFHNKAFDLQSARATLRASEYKQEAARLLLGRDVEQAYGDLVEATHRIAILGEAVDLSWKLVVSGQQKDAVGAGNATDLLRNLEKWYRRRFDYVEATAAYNQALARLSRAVGTPLIEGR